MSSKFSVSEIQSLCKEVKKGKYKGDPADVESYKAYLDELYYKRLLTAETVKAQLDKLQLTFTAGDAHKKEELTPRIELLKRALDALQSGGIDLDEQNKRSELKAVTAVSLVMIKNNPKNSGLSDEELVLKLDENVFYAFTVEEITAAGGSDTASAITYDTEFIYELGRIFARNDAAYMSVINRITELAGPYDASERYYGRVKSVLSDYRAKEKEKRRLNQQNDDELLNEIETGLIARMDGCNNARLKLSMLLAVYNPECVASLCRNRDIKAMDKVVIEDGTSFVKALEGSARYGMTAATIKSIAPYVNVELKTASGSAENAGIDIAELWAQKEEAKKQAAAAQRNEDLKKLKGALPYFENAALCEKELAKHLFLPEKITLRGGTVVKAIIIGGLLGAALQFGLLLMLTKAAAGQGDDTLVAKVLYAVLSIFGDSSEGVMKAIEFLLLISAIIGAFIALKIFASGTDKQNKKIEELYNHVAKTKKQQQEQLSIGSRAVEDILPEEFRKPDMVKEIISMLEYNRVESIGEAMNLISARKHS